MASDEEAEAWEEFLCAFETCSGLRRIDLSANDLSGPRAFEIFTRIYFRQAPFDPTGALLPRRNDSHSNDAKDDVEDVTAGTGALSISRNGTCSPLKSTMPGGLRHVPYIVLLNVRMEDAGGLFLSYALARHSDPKRLLPPLKPGPVLAQLEEYDHATDCRGLIYSNERLSNFGTKLIEAAEVARSDTTTDRIEDDPEEQLLSSDTSPAKRENVNFNQHIFSAHGHTKEPKRRNRRSSMISSESSNKTVPDRRKSSVFDLDSLRRKLQRETVEHYGLNSVDLWRVSMKLLTVARRVLPPIIENDNAPIVDRRRFVKDMQVTAAAPGEPVLAVTGTTALFQAPKITDMLAGGESTTTQLPSCINASDDNAIRDPSLPFQLPLHIWKRIFRDAIDPRRVLSDEQVDSVMAYARDRRTLAAEREIRHKDVSVQKWHVLEGTDCLSYKMRAS